MLPNQLRGLAGAGGCPSEHQAMQRDAGARGRAESSHGEHCACGPLATEISEQQVQANPESSANPRSVSMGPRWRGVDVPGGPTLTPADEDVPPDVPLVGGEGEQQQGLQVHALHQQPVEVGQDRVLEEGDGCFAVHL